MGKTFVLLANSLAVAPDGRLESQDPWTLLPGGPRRLLAEAASEAFSKRGFHATTTRDIATSVGISPAGLYVHYSSKAELLFTISQIGHEAALSSIIAAIKGVVEPAKRVKALVKSFTAWHALNHKLARVLQYELHALQPAHYEVIAAIRRTTQRQVEDELRRVVRPRTDLKITTNAVLSLSIDVARWYDPEKGPKAEALGEKYGQLVMEMLGIKKPRA